MWGCINPNNCLEIPDSFDVIEGPETLLEPTPQIREARQERRVVRALLRLSRDSRLRIRLALEMLEGE